MSLENVKKGDTVWVHRSSRYGDPPAPEPSLVTSAGPTYVTASFGHWNGTKFHRHSGENVTDTSPSMTAYVSMEAFHAEQERSSLVNKARLALQRATANRCTTEQLKALLALLETLP